MSQDKKVYTILSQWLELLSFTIYTINIEHKTMLFITVKNLTVPNINIVSG